MAKKEYESKAITTKISATSRCAVKVRDNYYTIEFTEERAVDVLDINLDKERALLWDDVNAVVDDQINQILNTFK